MTITYCERHNEYYSSNEDADYYARKEAMSDLMRKVEVEAMEALKAIIISNFPAYLTKSDKEYLGDRLNKLLEGCLTDHLSELSVDRELVGLVELD